MNKSFQYFTKNGSAIEEGRSVDSVQKRSLLLAVVQRLHLVRETAIWDCCRTALLVRNVGRELNRVVSTHPHIDDQEAVQEAIRNWIIPALVKRFLAENTNKVAAAAVELAPAESIHPPQAKSQ